MMKIPILISLLFMATGSYGQAGEELTIKECYKLILSNYPKIKDLDIIKKDSEYRLDNLTKNLLPNITVNSRVSYQSDVTELPIEMAGVPKLDKFQYKVYGEVDQMIYNGKVTDIQKDRVSKLSSLEQDRVQVDIYHVNQRVEQLFLGTHLIDQQIKLKELYREQLQTGVNISRSQVKGGNSIKSDLDILQVKILELDQYLDQLRAVADSYRSMLSTILGEDVRGRGLELPELLEPDLKVEIARPELSVFESKEELLDIELREISAKEKPYVGLFLQAGIGAPGLNMLDPDPKGYYLGGAKFNWNLSSLYRSKNNRELVTLERSRIDVEREEFLLNVNSEKQKVLGQFRGAKRVEEHDDKIVELRESIRDRATTRFKQGIINSRDYLKELNEADLAKQNRVIHQIELLQIYFDLRRVIGDIN